MKQRNDKKGRKANAKKPTPQSTMIWNEKCCEQDKTRFTAYNAQYQHRHQHQHQHCQPSYILCD